MANTTTTKVNRLGLTHRQTVMIVLLLVGTFVTVLNQTVVAPALPSIMVDMSINAATGQWLTTGFTQMCIRDSDQVVDASVTRDVELVVGIQRFTCHIL